jgi:hypothetical protein
MRILCDQMVKERFVSVLDSEDRQTVISVRDRLAPTPPTKRSRAYAAHHLTADDD